MLLKSVFNVISTLGDGTHWFWSSKKDMIPLADMKSLADYNQPFLYLPDETIIPHTVEERKSATSSFSAV